MKFMSSAKYFELINKKNALDTQLSRLLWGVCDVLDKNKALHFIAHGVGTGEVDYATKDRRFRVRFNMYTDLFQGIFVNGCETKLPELLQKLNRLEEYDKHAQNITTV
jgi:hypothetical protein